MLLTEDRQIATAFINTLAASAFQAYCFETPALHAGSEDSAFEFVLVNAPEFVQRQADQHTFAEFFPRADSHGIVRFENLGGDAEMICPCPVATESNYAHLANFTRHAPLNQQYALWQQTATACLTKISRKPLWLNTAGGGVAWLHIRLDTQPKYYRYRPFAQLLP